MSDENNKKKNKQFNETSKGGDLVKESFNTQFDHIQAVEFTPLQVQVQNNFDRAMKAFRALVQKDRILSLYKEKQRYEKPSDKKRRKRNESLRKSLDFDTPREFKTKPKDFKKTKEKTQEWLAEGITMDNFFKNRVLK